MHEHDHVLWLVDRAQAVVGNEDESTHARFAHAADLLGERHSANDVLKQLKSDDNVELVIGKTDLTQLAATSMYPLGIETSHRIIRDV